MEILRPANHTFEHSELLSHRSYLSLHKICSRAPKELPISQSDLIRSASQVTQYFNMEDLEIALWGIYLERFAWISLLTHSSALYFSAFTAHSYLNDLPSKPDLSEDYHKWLSQYTGSLYVDYYTLNSYFKMLYEPKPLLREASTKDYEQIVDYIMNLTHK